MRQTANAQTLHSGVRQPGVFRPAVLQPALVHKGPVQAVKKVISRPGSRPMPKQPGFAGFIKVAQARALSRPEVARSGSLRQGLSRPVPLPSGPLKRVQETNHEEVEELPPDWEEHFSDEHQMNFFWNSITGTSVWEKPTLPSGPLKRVQETNHEEVEELPPDWEEHFSDKHQMNFFWNSITGTSVWEKPTSAKRKATFIQDDNSAGAVGKKRKVDQVFASRPFDHAATSADFKEKVSHVSGRTVEERQAAKEEYRLWADERLEQGADPSGSNAESFDWWYCQVCLICLRECEWNVYNCSHKTSKAHKSKYINGGGYMLKAGVQRPDPQLERPLQDGSVSEFVSCAGFADSRVLSLGEQDYSFSLAVAKVQSTSTENVSIVATSYLAAHDPSEPEVHVKDDAMRAHFSRKSLPGMDGALQRNIDELTAIGGLVLHSVDATHLTDTLLSQHSDLYDLIVFPFPRASLQRGCQPKNPSLIRSFFQSVNDAGILEFGGKIGIILLRTQFAEWDTACAALDAGYHLMAHTALPDGFYQGREMSGKIFDSWKKIGAEIYMFQRDV